MPTVVGSIKIAAVIVSIPSPKGDLKKKASLDFEICNGLPQNEQKVDA
jgi:hypothetical protein